MNENDMIVSGLVRRSLIMYFNIEVNNNDGQERPEKTIPMKK
jgi:hypothetical protein